MDDVTKEWVVRARKVHGHLYDYSNTRYRSSRVPVEIRCPFHGVFRQAPYVHLRGSGCPKCGHNSRNYFDDKYQEWLDTGNYWK